MKLEIIERNPLKLKQNCNSENYRELLNLYEDFYKKIGFTLPWVGYFIINENKIVGSCGFVGPPEKGRVEISYWTFKEYEGQGIAGFACSQLIKIAHSKDENLNITAKTAPQNNASTTILQKNGFEFSGIVQDEGIGDAWLWINRHFKKDK
ncbi:GNAT family N-acetyltransferase [Aequorivita aquimaris]|uniref:GNAT family N-acetyltransferase n=1 Tax=Aequorivita aquimaris TaxID=1548749 RepID=UPI000787B9F6|nr:GNAT family N-acetyltransferase [Aequorivita aquimaris]